MKTSLASSAVHRATKHQEPQERQEREAQGAAVSAVAAAAQVPPRAKPNAIIKTPTKTLLRQRRS